jgi:hypothetical protein
MGLGSNQSWRCMEEHDGTAQEGDAFTQAFNALSESNEQLPLTNDALWTLVEVSQSLM